MATNEVVHSTHVYGIATIEVVPNVLLWTSSDSAMPIPYSIATFNTPAHGSDKMFLHDRTRDPPARVQTGTSIKTRVDVYSSFHVSA